MKSIFAALLLTLTLGLAPLSPAEAAEASGRKLGLGVLLGDPTGFTAVLQTAPGEELRPLLAWSQDVLFLAADYDFRFPGASWLPAGLRKVVPYAGIGGSLLFSGGGKTGTRANLESGDTFGLALRVPLGLQYRLDKTPLEFSLEFAPGMGLIPSTRFLAEGGVGVTFFLH